MAPAKTAQIEEVFIDYVRRVFGERHEGVALCPKPQLLPSAAARSGSIATAAGEAETPPNFDTSNLALEKAKEPEIVAATHDLISRGQCAVARDFLGSLPE